MKKIVIMLVCAAFLLSGCGKKENEVEPPSDTGKVMWNSCRRITP